MNTMNMLAGIRRRVVSLAQVVSPAVILFLPGPVGALENDNLRADFDGSGLIGILDKRSGSYLSFTNDTFSLQLDAVTLNGASFTPVLETSTATQQVYRYDATNWTVRAVYELKDDRAFITKHLWVTNNTLAGFHLGTMTVQGATISPSVASAIGAAEGSFLRTTNGCLLLTMQNPFPAWTRNTNVYTLGYTPDMEWDLAWGAFESDRLIMAPYTLSGRIYPAMRDWLYYPDSTLPAGGLDEAEVAAYQHCVRASILEPPTNSVRIHVGWTVNDYQIDVATAAGREEYKRIIDQAAAVGCGYVLYTPANSTLAPPAQNTDNWGWEDLLWLNLGQKVRKDEWTPGVDPLPAEVVEMVNYAESRGVKLLAYVFPTLPFAQNPAWTDWPRGLADTGQRSFQDWLVDKLEAFYHATGIGGYSFDHWFIHYNDAPSSRYAQWYGCRRVLEELRRRVPGIVIDGRQAYHATGAWTWLAGNYPHPLLSDEQPESFDAFPDLHWSRSAADFQRRVAWELFTEDMCPIELMPGYMSHQTPRRDDNLTTRRDRFRPADFDFLGFKYSVLSSIGTAPMNHVVNFLPARDTNEFAAFTTDMQTWVRDWLDWTDEHFDVLSHLRPIIHPPQVGKVDGTAALTGGEGFIFLFNPNYRIRPAVFAMNESIGFDAAGPVTLRQLYPDDEKGKLIAPSDKPVWMYGDVVELDMPGKECMVLEVAPVPAARPLLFNRLGYVVKVDDRLHITDVSGEPGDEINLHVLLADSASISQVVVNGVECRFLQDGDTVTVPVRFPGEPFGRRQQIGEYDPDFTGGAFTAEAVIPQAVVEQIADRTNQWPVTYTEQEQRAPWLRSDQLLLFVHIADPADTFDVKLTINGETQTLTRAYTSISTSLVHRTFVGWYTDVSWLPAETSHTFEVTMPAMAAGRFQGLFLDTVDATFQNQLETGTELPRSITATSDFSTAHNFLTEGPGDWDGVYTMAGSITNLALGSNGAGTTLVALATGGSTGQLVVTTRATDWENNNDDGFFLYRSVNGDFRAEVDIVSHQVAAYNFAGIMARIEDPAAGGAGEDYVIWAAFDQFGWGNYLRSVDNGSTGNATSPFGTPRKRHIALERSGNTFSAYERASESDAWELFDSVSRSDMIGLPLQVGLMHATFSGNSRTTVFDQFVLTESGVPVALPSPFERWTEISFGTNAANPAVGGADANPDGDAYNNTEEFIALTDPMDSAEYPLVEVEWSEDGPLYSTDGRAGRIYAVEERNDFTSVWATAQTADPLHLDSRVQFAAPQPFPAESYNRIRISRP